MARTSDRGPVTRKLRRNRRFAEGAGIRSQIPTSAAPQSRRYAGNGAAASAAPLGAPVLTLDSVVDRGVCGDARAVLRQLPDEGCACAVTSPPYWHTVD